MYYTIQRENKETGEVIILNDEQRNDLAVRLNGNIRVVQAMTAGIPFVSEGYHYTIVGSGGRMVMGKPPREDIWWQGILDNLQEQGILGEYLGEGKDRIVYSHATTPGTVIKIPKNTDAEDINIAEYETYMQEHKYAISMGKKYLTDGLAQCYYDAKNKVLYMEKLHITEGSNFGINPDGIIRRFDLNPII